MKKRKMRRRNLVARAVRQIRPKVVPSAKTYNRRSKHKGRFEIQNRDGLFLFLFLEFGKLFSRHLLFADDADDFGGGSRDVCAGAINGGDAFFKQEVIILGRDDTAADDQYVLGATIPEGLDQLRHQGLVAGGLRRYADDVDVVFDGLAGGFLGRLEHRA